MTNSVREVQEDTYTHSLFFAKWSDESEREAEQAESFVRTTIPDVGDTWIAMEEGEPVELRFWTPDKVSDFDMKLVLQQAQSVSYQFNTEDY